MCPFLGPRHNSSLTRSQLMASILHFTFNCSRDESGTGAHRRAPSWSWCRGSGGRYTPTETMSFSKPRLGGEAGGRRADSLRDLPGGHWSGDTRLLVTSCVIQPPHSLRWSPPPITSSCIENSTNIFTFISASASVTLPARMTVDAEVTHHGGQRGLGLLLTRGHTDACITLDTSPLHWRPRAVHAPDVRPVAGAAGR